MHKIDSADSWTTNIFETELANFSHVLSQSCRTASAEGKAGAGTTQSAKKTARAGEVTETGDRQVLAKV